MTRLCRCIFQDEVIAFSAQVHATVRGIDSYEQEQKAQGDLCMLIEETFAVKAPIEKVWDFLMDPDASGPCVPGCEKVEVVDDKTYRVRVKTKVSFLAFTFNMKVEIIEMNRPFHLESTSAGEDSKMTSKIRVKSSLDLKSVTELETEISYRSDISLFGNWVQWG